MTVGERCGAYAILAPIGKGGMGEVWQARDTRLGRDVALKILPPAFASDPDRMARFEREARVLASLDHPNIAAIYGVEESDSVRALVLALVDGPTLADRIAAGPIPVDEAIQIARQIAEAVEYAHDRGVIHRDLKPANIKIASGGMVKVLDFGLAKALDDEPASGSATNSPTLTMNATRAGVMLGTAQYMSPEQAKGKQADRRSDIWSFGAVLYEMVTGKPAFSGETAGDILASVIKDEPKLDAVPAEMRGLVGRCLTKDPRKRLQAIGEARIILEEPAISEQLAVAPTKRTEQLPWMIVAAILVLVAVGLGFGWWRSTRAAPLKPLVRLDVDLGADVSLGSPYGVDAILSPDGNRLVFVSKGRLFTRRLDQLKATELAGTDGAYEPFFSPDGQWIAFFTLTRLKKISIEGGAAIALCNAPAGRGGSWGEGGDIVANLANGGGLWRVPAAGGTPAGLTELAPGEVSHRWPQILPGGKAMLFTAATGGGYDDANLEVMTLVNGKRKTLQRGATFGRYLAVTAHRGYVAYINRGTLFAVPFDLDKLEIHGTPAPMLEQVAYAPTSGSAQVAFSGTGALVYRTGGAVGSALLKVQWLDRTGKTQPLLSKPGAYGRPHLSPDGTRLALEVSDASGNDEWVYDWQRDTMTRVTFGGVGAGDAAWSPDGRFLVYQGISQGSGGIFWTRADGSGQPQSLVQSKDILYPRSFTPDGKRLAYNDQTSSAGMDIWTVAIENDGANLRAGKPEPFLQTPSEERFPMFSPDGHWLAYASNESGMFQVYVRGFPDKSGKWQVSNDGGVLPVWSRNGRDLFFRTEDGRRVFVVSYTSKGDSFVADKPRVWLEKPLGLVVGNTAIANYDVSSDGKRIAALMLAETPEAQAPESHVIFLQNFSDELRRRVPVPK